MRTARGLGAKARDRPTCLPAEEERADFQTCFSAAFSNLSLQSSRSCSKNRLEHGDLLKILGILLEDLVMQKSEGTSGN